MIKVTYSPSWIIKTFLHAITHFPNMPRYKMSPYQRISNCTGKVTGKRASSSHYEFHNHVTITQSLNTYVINY